MNGKLVKLKDVINWVRGLTYSKKNEVEKDGIAVLRATNIDLASHKIILDEIRYISKLVKVKKEKYLKRGDILICTASGSKSHLGKVALVEQNFNMAFGGFMAVLRCTKDCNPKFLYHILTSLKFKKHLSSLSDGANINNLKFSQIEGYEFFLPSLKEQSRIVTKLDESFAKIDKVSKFVDTKDKTLEILSSSTLTKIFHSLPSKEVELGDICNFIRGPFGGSLKKNIFVKKGYCIYEQKHAIRNQSKDFRYFITSEKYEEMKRFAVNEGDILMSCSGTIGKTTIVPANAPKGIINQALLKITPSDKINVEYLNLYMQCSLFKEQLLNFIDGAAIQNVASVKILKKLKIKLPSIDLQKQTISRLNTLISEINLAKNILNETKKNYSILKSSILTKEIKSEEAA